MCVGVSVGGSVKQRANSVCVCVQCSAEGKVDSL